MATKAVEDYRSPRRFATPGRGEAARIWSAPAELALWDDARVAVGVWQSAERVPAGTESGRGLPQSRTLRESPERRVPPGDGVGCRNGSLIRTGFHRANHRTTPVARDGPIVRFLHSIDSCQTGI